MNEIRSYADLIWGVAELLRGDYKQADYGKVILPLVLMRRLDQALETTKGRGAEACRAARGDQRRRERHGAHQEFLDLGCAIISQRFLRAH